MMGTRERAFTPLCNLSLERLAPAGHFYRLLEAKLDLALARELVRHAYKQGAAPRVGDQES